MILDVIISRFVDSGRIDNVTDYMHYYYLVTLM